MDYNFLIKSQSGNSHEVHSTCLFACCLSYEYTLKFDDILHNNNEEPVRLNDLFHRHIDSVSHAAR